MSLVQCTNKNEPKPKCITPELEEYYEQTDLSLQYVYDCCKTLKPLKGIDVNAQQVQFWYVEFIKMGWKKKDFDKQFESVKRATLFGRLDFETWVKTEMMYNEIDFAKKLSEMIDAKIIRGKYLKDKKIELTDAEKKEVDLAIAKEIELGYHSGWYEARETYQQERRQRILGKR